MSSIHQEITLPAAPSRVYEVLVDSKEFAAVTGAPASGLVPAKRIVQAWRVKAWPEGLYSIVRFELSADGKGTKLVFDHEGFPEDMKEHLAQGWHANYWEKIAKHVGS